MFGVVIVIVIFNLLLFLGQGVGEKDEEDVTTALTIDVPKVSFLIFFWTLLVPKSKDTKGYPFHFTIEKPFYNLVPQSFLFL